MRRILLAGLLAAGCAPVTLRAPAPPSRWVHAETEANRLDYSAGDGAVVSASRVLVLQSRPSASSGRRPPPLLALPARVEVGEIFSVEIRVPRAEEGERRTFRLRCGRRGLRLLDGDRVETVGRHVAARRAVADSAGPAMFDIEDIGD